MTDAKEPTGATDPPGDASAVWLRVPGGRRRRADEWALVLASQGIACRIRPAGGGLVLEVDPGDRARAQAALNAYLLENPSARRDTDAASSQAGDLPQGSAPTPLLGEPGAAGLAVSVALILVYLAIGDRRHDHPVFGLASADAALILDGQWWRAVTALCLHADLAHVLGNAFFGLYFVTAVCSSLGSGLGLTLVLASGAGGNLLNALSYGRFHDSVGASTAVFGAIGLLAGLALARRQREGLRGRRLILPIGAGLGLLAMLGTTGARVDIWAHFYGLFVGAALGFGFGASGIRRPGPRVQWLLGGSSALFLALCWELALR